MKLSVAAKTDVGRVRTNNEDYLLSVAAEGLFIVCDGMGGHNAGEVASQMTCEVVARELTNNVTQAAIDQYKKTGTADDAKALKKIVETAIVTACREVFGAASRDSGKAGMGTTCTAVLLIGHRKGIMGHVGDSRLYVSRSNSVHQLSEDHTYVNELVKRGIIRRSEAHDHPQGNVLSRALGVQPTVAVDTMIFDLDPGDTFLLCSDGVHNYFNEALEFLPHLALPDLQAGLDSLINLALERGGHDNATGISFRVESVAAGGSVSVAADERIAILKRIPIFTHLNYHELVKVLGLTQLTTIEASRNLTEEGQAGSEMYVVLSGETEIVKGDDVIATLPAGVHLGEMALVDNAPRSATARAKTDLSVLTMRREEFFSLIKTEPVIATKLLWSLVQVLSGRLRDTNEALKGARQELAGTHDDTGAFEILFDDEEL